MAADLPIAGAAAPSGAGRGAQSASGAPGTEGPSTTGVEQANKAVADQAGVPDGPNVGPSPKEHLAAQGKVDAAQRPPSGAGAAGTGARDTSTAAAPEASPEEQELVDEQIQRDREASRKADPSST